MFGFGSKFNSRSLNSFGKVVADYLHSSGELVLIKNRVDEIPLVHEIEDDGSCMTLKTSYDFLTNTVEKNSYLTECW